MTHRVFSRNASSSRAIPIAKLIQDVIDDPVMPLKWLANKPGMQGGEEITGVKRAALIQEWLDARANAIETARRMTTLGAHKQHVNRVLEPFCHINVLVSSTSWANWDALRDHPNAQPEIEELAKQIKLAAAASTPSPLKSGQWHLPYVTPGDWVAVHNERKERDGELMKTLIKLSVARCARVSYLTQGGVLPTLTKDLELYERLMGGVPLHASPAEHQATPDTITEGHKGSDGDWNQTRWDHPDWHGNFDGWIQYRRTLANQCVADEPYRLDAA
jgi:thymidylate synthase ThyX